MKKTLLSLLSLVLLFVSCKKDEGHSQTFIQLQKIGSTEDVYAFQYNEDHLPIQIDLFKNEGGVSELDEYFTISYENGAPVNAEYFNKNDGSFKLSARYTFTADAQKRITKSLIKRFSSNGTELPETIKRDYSFNSSGKLVKIIFNEDQSNPRVFEYDANGDYKESPYTNDQPTLKHTRTTDYKYDNSINPFSVNGLGIMMMVAFDGEVFNADMLLSEHNVSSSRVVDTRIDYPGTQFQETTVETQSIAYTNVYDQNGGLKKIDFTRSYKAEYQNEVTRDDSYQYSLDVTCMKKNK